MRQDTEKRDASDQELKLEIQKANYFATAARENWISIVSFLVFLVVWELICRFDLIGPYQLVPPSEVITVFFEKLTDVNPDGTVLQQHALASLALALAGFLAAVVIGGTPMGGGSGTVVGTLFGCLVIGLISNGLNLLRVSSFWQMVSKGVIILVAVILDVYSEKIYERMRNKD